MAYELIPGVTCDEDGVPLFDTEFDMIQAARAHRVRQARAHLSAKEFAHWWTFRNVPNDKAIVRLAKDAELIESDGGMLFLTNAGKQFRRAVTVRA